MSFPVIEYPIYECKLPSNDKKIKFRPYKTTHEKLLLMAIAKGSEQRDMELALKQTVAYCILDEKIDVDKLPIFDLMYIWVQARSRSVSEKINIDFKGQENSQCEECKKPKIVEIKLSDIKVEKNKDHSPKIELEKGIGVMMKYPCLESMSEIENLGTEEDSEKVLDSIAKFIEYVYDKESVYRTEDQKPEEVVAWLDGLTPQHFGKILAFFYTMPKLKHTIEWTCSKCNTKLYYEMEDIESFFA